MTDRSALIAEAEKRYARQRNPSRDAALTASLHDLLCRVIPAEDERARQLRASRRRSLIGIIGWVQVDVRFLR